MCTPQAHAVSVTWRIFESLRRLRSRGDDHCLAMMAAANKKEGTTRTLRETEVMVIPNCHSLTVSFELFDGLILGINGARRDGRNYLVGSDEDDEDGRGGDRWQTAVNLSHMHPKWGENKEDGDDNNDEEEDPVLTEYKQRRLRARRSPHPTCVMEVKCSPEQPLSRGGGGDDSAVPTKELGGDAENLSQRRENVDRLERLLTGGPTAGASTANDGDDDTEDGSSARAEEEVRRWIARASFKSLLPLEIADALFASSKLSLGGGIGGIGEGGDPTAADVTVMTLTARQVDEAYEQIFEALAELTGALPKTKTAEKGGKAIRQPPLLLLFLVLPNFCVRSCVSVDRFASKLGGLLDLIAAGTTMALESESNLASVHAFHPEQSDVRRRSSRPTLLLTLGRGGEEGRDSAGGLGSDELGTGGESVFE